MLKSTAIRSLCGTGSLKSIDSPVCKQIAGVWNGTGLFMVAIIDGDEIRITDLVAAADQRFALGFACYDYMAVFLLECLAAS